MNFFSKLSEAHQRSVFISKNIEDVRQIVKDNADFDIESIPLLKRDEICEYVIEKIKRNTNKKTKEIGFYDFLLLFVWELVNVVDDDEGRVSLRLLQTVKNLLVAKQSDLDERILLPFLEMFTSSLPELTKDELLIKFERLVPLAVRQMGIDAFESGYLALREGFVPFHCDYDAFGADGVLACVAVRDVNDYENLSALIDGDDEDFDCDEDEMNVINSYTISSFLLDLFSKFDAQSASFKALEWE